MSTHHRKVGDNVPQNPFPNKHLVFLHEHLITANTIGQYKAIITFCLARGIWKIDFFYYLPHNFNKHINNRKLKG